MSGFLYALLPVIAIVSLGHILSVRKWIPTESWRAIERLSYVVLFPALIVRTLANAPFETAPWGLAAALILAQITLGAFGLLGRFMPNMPGPAVGSVIQSNVRWNTMIGLSIGSLLFGEQGLALVTIAAAVMIPTANIISVYALISHAENPHGPKPNPFVALIRNPIVIACILGLVLAAASISLPRLLDDSLRILGDAALALGLLAAGAGVDLSALRRAGPRTFGWSLVRLLGLPALAVGFCILLGVTGMPLVVALICAATPTATSSYILAKELGGDAPLAANLIAVETVLAMVTMPALYLLLTS
ncbi:MAG: AEC family transporter [Alphaproteobacteria bacterium]|nr:AEC family transporter [Alphaproteobacteria bacterium]|tara:strand:+ start:1998 stop:2912 length:915 start_codon:yes stop_codon:yes gene_type:complete